jgi:hypothetical protein
MPLKARDPRPRERSSSDESCREDDEPSEIQLVEHVPSGLSAALVVG